MRLANNKIYLCTKKKTITNSIVTYLFDRHPIRVVN